MCVLFLKECITCNSDETIKSLRSVFPGISVSELRYPDSAAAKLVKDLKINGLPAYLFGKEVEKEIAFDAFKANVELRGDYYLLKPEISGISYFTQREKIPGRIDLFFSLFQKSALELLERFKEFKPVLHFIGSEDKGNFNVPAGAAEAEEDMRSLCVQKHYPEHFWDYTICRAGKISSTWWEDCLAGVDTTLIKSCAQGKEGIALLKENLGLTQELKIYQGPDCLMDNLEIFSFKDIPQKEGLKKIIHAPR